MGYGGPEFPRKMPGSGREPKKPAKDVDEVSSKQQAESVRWAGLAVYVNKKPVYPTNPREIVEKVCFPSGSKVWRITPTSPQSGSTMVTSQGGLTVAFRNVRRGH